MYTIDVFSSLLLAMTLTNLMNRYDNIIVMHLKNYDEEILKKEENKKNQNTIISEEALCRKIECARYREMIKDFEGTLKNNAGTKTFYSSAWLAPIRYVRYLGGYDEKLKESNTQALREIHFYKELLRQNYCTESDEHE